MTTFTTKYSAETVSEMFPNMQDEDKGATLEITISYDADKWGGVEMRSSVATMHFPNGDVDDYTYEIEKHFIEEMDTNFVIMANEHLAASQE